MLFLLFDLLSILGETAGLTMQIVKTMLRMNSCVRFEERVKMQNSKGVFGAHSLQSGQRRGESNTRGDGELDVVLAGALQSGCYYTLLREVGLCSEKDEKNASWNCFIDFITSFLAFLLAD